MAHASNWKLRHRIYGLTLITPPRSCIYHGEVKNWSSITHIKGIYNSHWSFPMPFHRGKFSKGMVSSSVQPVAPCKTHVRCFKMVNKKKGYTLFLVRKKKLLQMDGENNYEMLYIYIYIYIYIVQMHHSLSCCIEYI